MASFPKNSWFALKSKATKGFTMIELLVVITVIGLLAALAGANYMTSLKKGRDTKRKGDMRKIQQAFEQYYGANQRYNTPCSVMATSDYYVGTYPPTDPRGVAYSLNCTASGYCACALLEQSGQGNATDTNCTFAASGNYFCVKNLQ